MQPTPLELARLVEYGEAEAFVDMYRDAPPELGSQVERIGSAIMLMIPALPIVLFNRILGLGLDEAATMEMVGAVVKPYQDAKINKYGVQLSPLFQPSELPSWLQAQGLSYGGNWAKMYRKPDTTVSVETDLRVESIGRERAADFAQVACASFGMPLFAGPWLNGLVGRTGWSHYLAYDGDVSVACGALFIRNKIGWLGIGGTLPAYRRRGAQGVIMAQRIRDAAVMGCDWVITETGEDTADYPNPSYHNMVRTGFKLAYMRASYVNV